MLAALKSVQDRDGLARLLGFEPRAMSYLIYVLPKERRYTNFLIPKASGGHRLISAPEPRLKLLQRRLANVLSRCSDDLEVERGLARHVSHAFRSGRSILTNAAPHSARRYVLNVDLSDFFGTINFGRVRGYFLKDRDFSLPDEVATTIAQIACHENALPQGSPCSPIISDLIGRILDSRLVRLSKSYGVRYTRYADDLTFSTNAKSFPQELAEMSSLNCAAWTVGHELLKAIQSTGFEPNLRKTRLQFKGSRQVVTGLVTNSHPNVPKEYVRSARIMALNWLATGTAYKKSREGDVQAPQSLSAVIGNIGHAHWIRNAEMEQSRTASSGSRPIDKFKPEGIRKLYGRLIFQKTFLCPDRPTLICEGLTDNVYLRAAIKERAALFPSLATIGEAGKSLSVSLFRYSKTAQDVLTLGTGSSAIARMIGQYRTYRDKIKHRVQAHPVIFLIDNDDGASVVFSSIQKNFKKKIDLASTDDYYHIVDNVYLVKTPETVPTATSAIEDLFPAAVLATKLGTKTFNRSADQDSSTEYGKRLFADAVVAPNADTIDFSGFDPLLARIAAVIAHHEAP